MEKPQLDIDSRKERIKKIIIERLYHFRNEWKSAIPEQIISGASPDIKYKVRKNWFQAVMGYLQRSVLYLLPPKKYQTLIEEILNFVRDYGSDEFKYRLTTREDIIRADFLIDKVISVLENL